MRNRMIASTLGSVLLICGLWAAGSPAVADPLPPDSAKPTAPPVAPSPIAGDPSVVVPFGDSAARAACPAPAEGAQVLCIAVGTEVGREARPGASADALVPLPDWCATTLNVVQVRRYQACGDQTVTVTVYQTVDGTTTATGTMQLVAFVNTYTSKDVANWGSQIEIAPSIITGSAVGMKVSGSAFCSGCTSQGQSFPLQTPSVGSKASGESFWSWSGVTGTYKSFVNVWTITFTTTAGATSNPYTYQTPIVRCDNAVSGISYSGCVFPIVVPGIFYPSGTQFAVHVMAAQASGLRGGSIMNPLHRLVQAQLQALNRSTACPASYPRPPAYSCDEYPFASTIEGAYLSGGGPRTFPNCSITLPGTPSTGASGFSVCMIPNTQNTLAGSQLNSVLYVPQRVINNDAFTVGFS